MNPNNITEVALVPLTVILIVPATLSHNFFFTIKLWTDATHLIQSSDNDGDDEDDTMGRPNSPPDPWSWTSPVANLN